MRSRWDDVLVARVAVVTATETHSKCSHGWWCAPSCRQCSTGFQCLQPTYWQPSARWRLQWMCRLCTHSTCRHVREGNMDHMDEFGHHTPYYYLYKPFTYYWGRRSSTPQIKGWPCCHIAGVARRYWVVGVAAGAFVLAALLLSLGYLHTRARQYSSSDAGAGAGQGGPLKDKYARVVYEQLAVHMRLYNVQAWQDASGRRRGHGSSSVATTSGAWGHLGGNACWARASTSGTGGVRRCVSGTLRPCTDLCCAVSTADGARGRIS